MLVRDIGEFKLIDRLAHAIAGENGRCFEHVEQRGFRELLGIGDDAAAWDGPRGVRVMTTDTMVEGIHFNLDHIDWRDLGWKSLATNLSDIAAMGCAPTYSMITLGLRGDLPVDGLVEMYRGMMDISLEHGGAIVGGDIVRSPTFFLTVALEGTAVATKDDKPAILTRHTALPGDQIAVTGHLGCSGGGLRMLLEEVESKFPQGIASHLRDTHNRPAPRVRQGMALAGSGVMTAMDVSDGLVDDLGKLCRASGVGARIRADNVPADRFLKRAYPEDWLSFALGGGEDYELLFTAPPDVMERVTQLLDVPVSIIGEIMVGEPRVGVLDSDGKAISVAHGGWDHFRE
jgi:thiamine-monophosphate kinase